MSQLSIEIQASAGTVERIKTFGAETEQRFIDWVWYAYPQVDENGDPLPDNAANRAAAFREWADGIVAGTWSNVKRWEMQEAAQQASDAVTDLE